ncbi:hypothetical protein HpMS107_56930 [Helicobacter pylori]
MANDFLVFGGDPAANVIDQPTYAALLARVTGFQAGVALSAQLNKVWRQSSIMAAVLAQFSTDLTGQSAVDDGTTATLLANLKVALRTNTVGAAVGTDVGTASAHVVNYTPVIGSLVDGTPFWYKVKFGNLGGVTLNVNGLGAFPVVGAAHQALTGGEYVSGGKALVVWRADINSFILILCTGGALQVSPGLTAIQAAQYGQLTGIVGSARNVSATLSAPATSITFTADELVAETALGGLQFKAANFSQTLNLAMTGIGGMDTGTAPISGFVGVYAGYNPTTQAWGVFATNATAAAVGNVYGGANRPAGYTATMLISVWPTNGSGQLIIATQQDRKISFAPIAIISTSTQQAAYALFNAAPAVPKNAKTCRPSVNINSSLASATLSTQVAASAAGVGECTITTVSVINNSGQATPLQHVPLITQQGLYYIATVTSGTMSFTLTICEYTF